jgi:hypothetical protein
MRRKAKKYIHDLVDTAVGMSAAGEVAQKSFTYAGGFGLAGWATKAAGASARTMAILTRTIYNPVEVLSLNIAMLVDKYLGGKDGLVTTDQRKNEQLIELAARSAQRGYLPTLAKIDAIMHPRGELVGTIGRGINSVITAPFKAAMWGGRKAVGAVTGWDTRSVEQKIEYNTAITPVGENRV